MYKQIKYVEDINEVNRLLCNNWKYITAVAVKDKIVNILGSTELPSNIKQATVDLSDRFSK